jgi:hypothetical protein
MSTQNQNQTSIRVNDSLERYGAKTFGSLPRRMERLQRFVAIENKNYAAELRQENTQVVWPALTITRENFQPERYNLRSTARAAQDLLALSRAIENGNVTTRRG